ncbi:hypothetical protein ACJ41O_015101 [Fusarium nematophilum]
MVQSTLCLNGTFTQRHAPSTPHTPIYHPLNPAAQGIRLLKIEGTDESSSHILSSLDDDRTQLINFFEGFIPSLRTPKSLLKCKLETFKLGETPEYRAISYTRGAPEPAGFIEVDGRMVSVQPNLLAALARLHRDYWFDYIWVDALCINQGDDDEKDHQVPIMNRIYKHADMQGPLSTLGGKISKQETYLLGKAKAINTKADRAAMKQLFENPHWARAWILQEVAHAEVRLVVYGRHVVDVDDLMGAAFFWDTAEGIPYDRNGQGAFAHGLDNFQVFRTIANGFAGDSSDDERRPDHMSKGDRAVLSEYFPIYSDLFRLFVDIRRFNATDRRRSSGEFRGGGRGADV